MNNNFPKKILIIRQGAIGDVVHTTETYRSIKRLLPDSEIHYLTTKTPAELLKNDPDLTKLIILQDRSYKGLFKLAKELKQEQYDLIINLQPSIRFKIFSFLCFSKQTVTYKKNFKYHAVENFFLTAKKAIKNLELKKELCLYIDEESISKTQKMLPPQHPIVVLNTQSGPVRHGRKWKMEYFRELSDSLIKEYNAQIIIIGSKEDAKKLDIFKNCNPNIHIVAGRLNLRETAALLAQCDFLISGDTGPLHIASASGHPVCIGLFGAMPIKRTGPWGEKHFALTSNLKCIPCNRRKCKFGKSEFNPCMNNLLPEDVMKFIREKNLISKSY